MASLSTLITQLRTLCRDLPTSNKSAYETPKGVCDGANTHFRLQNPILISGSIWYSIGSTFHSTTGVSIVDANLGLITISPAPSGATQNAPFIVDYFFNWFADADYTEYLNDAARDVAGTGDPTAISDGLISALLQFGLGHFYQARATQYASRYSSSGGQAGQSVQSVTKGFQDLSRAAFDRGKELRDAFHERLGQREAPAAATTAFAVDPVTPKR